MKQVICPNCNAEFEADATQLFVYCSYCGVKIQMRDIVEVRHVQVAESLEKMLSDGETFYKIEDYVLAEQKFREIIKQYPEERAGYEGVIRTLTRNETVYPIPHETELFRLLYKVEQLVSAQEKAEFEGRRRKMLRAFDEEHERVKQAQRDKEIDMEQQGRRDRLIYSYLIIVVVFIMMLLILIVDFVPPIEFSVVLVAFVPVSFWLIWKK